ncbi:MAG: MFS transporter [Alphaproteobacteria bacterium]|nr:MFS transporter [Alphaproteobacteria bacterium]
MIRIRRVPRSEPTPESREVGRLMLFFAIVYIVEGLGQTGGLIAQPLNYYLKQVYGWTPVQVTGWLTVLNLPWIIKPVYGIVSDFVPLFGYRRKAYLILANAAGTLAYLWVTQLTNPRPLILVLLLTAYAMAISSTLAGAVLVENGQRLNKSDAFVNQQWLWFNVAAVASAFLGGELVSHLPPKGALQMASAIIAVAPLAAIFGTVFLIDETPSRLDLAELKNTFCGLLATFANRELWLIGLFLFLYYLNPGFGLPLYYYMTDTLKFSQGFIGILGAINSIGWIVGALLYQRWLDGMTSRWLLNFSILIGTVTTAAFLLLSSDLSAAIINFFSGIAGMIAFVATLSLAADFCPKRAEGFAFAALMSVLNLSSALSNNLGSFLYEHAFHNQLTPLIIVSAASTALIFVFVPLLRLGDKPTGVAAS